MPPRCLTSRAKINALWCVLVNRLRLFFKFSRRNPTCVKSRTPCQPLCASPVWQDNGLMEIKCIGVGSKFTTNVVSEQHFYIITLRILRVCDAKAG